MHMDTLIQDFTGIILLILFVGFILSRLKIPYVIAYLIVGILIGPSGFGFIEDPAVLHSIESIGVLLLLFLWEWKSAFRVCLLVGKFLFLVPFFSLPLPLDVSPFLVIS